MNAIAHTLPPPSHCPPHPHPPLPPHPSSSTQSNASVIGRSISAVLPIASEYCTTHYGAPIECKYRPHCPVCLSVSFISSVQLRFQLWKRWGRSIRRRRWRRRRWRGISRPDSRGARVAALTRGWAGATASRDHRRVLTLEPTRSTRFDWTRWTGARRPEGRPTGVQRASNGSATPARLPARLPGCPPGCPPARLRRPSRPFNCS